MRKPKSLSGWLLLCGLLCFLAVPGFGQLNSGTLTGLVTDYSGGALAGAEVLATEVNTQAQFQGTTDSEGIYTIAAVQIGNYTLTVKHAGFQTYIQPGVVMDAGAHRRVDVSLKVGSATETVQVKETAPLLETETGQYTTTENIQALQELPVFLNGGKRNPVDYIAALPGVQQGPGFGNQINGSVGLYSDIYVDGVPVENDPSVRGWFTRTFAPDAVRELKEVQTPMADLGNNGGVVIAYTTNSGTNQFHGSAYDFLQSNSFNAACYFCVKTPGRSSPVPADHQDEWGFYVGGPVFIPKVYDGRNKTFFWFNAGHYHFNFSGAPAFYSVPTDAWKTGNFSDILTNQQIGTDVLGRPVFAGEIFDPSTTRTVNGTIVRDPFAGNVVTSAFSPIATSYQSHFPAVNLPGDANNYFVQAGLGSSPDTYYTIKIDQYIKGKDRISGTYWVSNNPVTPALNFPGFFDEAVAYTTYGRTVRLNWTHTFNPNLVHTINGGVDRLGALVPAAKDALTGGTAIGLKNPLGGTCTPFVGITNISNPLNFGVCNINQWSTPFSVYDTWTYVHGKHLMSFGGDIMRFNLNWILQNDLGFTFLQGTTAQPNQPNCANCQTQTGSSYATFLLGGVGNSFAQGLYSSDPRSIVYGIYGQDQFKATKRLTVTLGLRYDLQPFPREAHDRWTSFNPTVPNAAAGGHPGALTFAGVGPGRLNSRDLVPTQYWRRNFGPKVSFAYRLADKTVARAAWTWSYGPTNESGFLYACSQGFFPNFGNASTDGFTPVFNWNNGFPFPPGVPLYNNTDPTLYNGSGTCLYGPRGGYAPTIENVHADVQHLFPGDVLVTVGYNGTFGHGILTTGLNVNQLDFRKYGRLGNLLVQDINSPAAQAAGIPVPYPGFQGSVAQALRPFPQYQQITNQSGDYGIETYNALQVTAKKDFKNGLSFLAGYTFSKEFVNYYSWPGAGTGTPQDSYNLRAEKTVTGYTDIPHQITFNYTYQLPIGRGRNLNINNRVLDAVIGGWSIAGIHNYQSGIAIPVTTDRSLTPTANGFRPDVVPGVPARTNVSCGNFNPYKDVYLNVNAFADPAPFTFGNAKPYLANVRACPSLGESVSLHKSFLLTERITFKIGTDVSNPLNRHVWGLPNGDIDSPAFGQITSTSNGPRTVQLNARVSW